MLFIWINIMDYDFPPHSSTYPLQPFDQKYVKSCLILKRNLFWSWKPIPWEGNMISRTNFITALTEIIGLWKCRIMPICYLLAPPNQLFVTHSLTSVWRYPKYLVSLFGPTVISSNWSSQSQKSYCISGFSYHIYVLIFRLLRLVMTQHWSFCHDLKKNS